MSASTSIRESRPEDDPLIAHHFYRMWRDNGVTGESIAGDWESRVLSFIRDARLKLRYRAFLAEADGAGVVGSAGCQLFSGLYPDILDPKQRLYGYLWGVYVEADHRRQGIAHQLTQAATSYLASIGCTRTLLHASPLGQSVYVDLGFKPTNELGLKLIE